MAGRARHRNPYHRCAGQAVRRNCRKYRQQADRGGARRAAQAGFLMRFARVAAGSVGFVSYALLRFEINVRGASVMGFVGAGGIGQEFVESDPQILLLGCQRHPFAHHRHRHVDRHRHGRVRRRLFGWRSSAHELFSFENQAGIVRAKYPDIFRPAWWRRAKPQWALAGRLRFFCSGWSISTFSFTELSDGMASWLDPFGDDCRPILAPGRKCWNICMRSERRFRSRFSARCGGRCWRYRYHLLAARNVVANRIGCAFRCAAASIPSAVSIP